MRKIFYAVLTVKQAEEWFWMSLTSLGVIVNA
jgi:hypothetical protein